MLTWQKYECGDDSIEAYGVGKRQYTVWKEVGQYIVDVDDHQLGYGEFNECKQIAEEHDANIKSRKRKK